MSLVLLALVMACLIGFTVAVERSAQPSPLPKAIAQRSRR